MIYGINEYYNTFDSEPLAHEFDSYLEATSMIIAESELNYNTIMESVGISELLSLQATGDDVLYESADNVKAFFNRIKEFFEKMIKKLKGIYEHFIALLDSYVKNDKKFVEKYKKKLENPKNLNKIEIKGFTYTIEDDVLNTASNNLKAKLSSDYVGEKDVVSNGALTVSDVEAIAKKLENKTEIADELRAASIKSSDKKLNQSEFKKELFKKFRGSKSEKEDITVDSSLLSKSFDYITTADSDKKIAKKALITLEDDIKKTLNELKAAERAVKSEKSSEETSLKMRVIKERIDLLKIEKATLQTINGCLLQAIKDRSRQAKKICVAAVGAQSKKEDENSSTNESYGFGNFLNGVNLI